MEMKLGPLGDYSVGEKWEETGHDKISHIFVNYGKTSVKSIQFGYVENGALVMSKRHGQKADEEDSTRIVRLNHETEFVTGISGEKSYSHLSSLTFHTNERKHLVFEAEFDLSRERRPPTREFHSGIHDRREFGGFFGSYSNWSFHSLGLYIRPILSGVQTIKQEDV
ncbi:unnamed protein product [Microthlaspi erraticum]|uniref:Jacalin-type lectin domain-containing protein n=1 Tax=Microthlaspi erraticum TaxID=1685480 RepID=A0A6D2J157_9BRAS|nr:unnamed protein product [Microthlaspi erraticum]